VEREEIQASAQVHGLDSRERARRGPGTRRCLLPTLFSPSFGQLQAVGSYSNELPFCFCGVFITGRILFKDTTDTSK
jgi:hypothetical protein